MYYPCSENKDADQLRGYREADLRLCFRLCKLLVFSCTGSIRNYFRCHSCRLNCRNYCSLCFTKFTCFRNLEHVGFQEVLSIKFTFLIFPVVKVGVNVVLKNFQCSPCASVTDDFHTSDTGIISCEEKYV